MSDPLKRRRLVAAVYDRRRRCASTAGVLVAAVYDRRRRCASTAGFLVAAVYDRRRHCASTAGFLVAAVYDRRRRCASTAGFLVAAVYDRRRRCASMAGFDGHRPPLQAGHRPPRQAGGPRHRDGFTLIEVMLASVMAAMILLAVYTVFSRAIKLRDNATARVRSYQLRARASRTIRNDLRNAWISGGVLASVLEGSPTGSDGLEAAAPGYLKFTTTTGKDTDDDLYGDVQQVEYYIAKDNSNGASLQTGKLVRILTRDLLDTTAQQTENQELLLANVKSFTVAFWDGTQWQDSWQYSNTATSGSNSSNSGSGGNTGSTSTSSTSSGTSAGLGETTVPEAVRVDIQQAAIGNESLPPPLEITVPLNTQPFTAPPTS